jgi:dTDP-4-dehydrorhamnose 3,5-epimerase
MEIVSEPGVVQSTSLDGVFVFAPQRHGDDRGWFVRTFDRSWCDDVGFDGDFVQHNQTRSARGVLRGLHVRVGRGEVKLVRCANGTVVDHIVDFRPWSPTFRCAERFILDDVDMRVLYLPPFVAHGFQVISKSADLCYSHSRAYVADEDISIAWNDPSLALEWPIPNPTLSERDASAPQLDEVDLYAMFVR